MSDSDVANQLRATADAFADAYGHPPTVAATAPGRVNLIGEHTDYNDGFVLPMAIERQTVIVASPRDDQTIRLRSTAFDEDAVFALSQNLLPGEPDWSNYFRGPIKLCLDTGLVLNHGFDAMIDSTVPTGGGLSSSASLEVATATLMEVLSGQTLDPVGKALLAQQAEHDYAGVPCGIMDQFISAMGKQGAALLIDCRTHETTDVPMADPSVEVLIINSNVKHALTGGEYAQRRAECEAAAKTLGVAALRDASMKQLEAFKDELSDTEYRRARHVIGENERTLDAAAALRRGDWPTAGTLMFASHDALRDDFEVSCQELDILVDLATQACPEYDGRPAVIGSRMTGGGFGGCTVSLVHTDAAEAATRFICDGYRDATGIEPTAFTTRPAAGARALDL